MLKRLLGEYLKKSTRYRKWLLTKFDNEVYSKINHKVNEYQLLDKVPIFDVIEIETINRCNSTCSFCPVNKNSDSRVYSKMSEKLFSKILDELHAMNYSKRIAMYSNNEPLLDKRIYEWLPKLREKLPNAFIYMYSNGTLLDVEKFKKLIPYLDQLFIDNYTNENKLHDNVKEVLEYWNNNPLEGHRFEVSIRKLDETLTTRGGEAPNQISIPKLKSSCLLPFEQLVVRPDGKISLCCADALGKVTLGDLNEHTIDEVWNGKEMMKYRDLISKGRKNIKICQQCDVYYGDLDWPSWKPH